MNDNYDDGDIDSPELDPNNFVSLSQSQQSERTLTFHEQAVLGQDVVLDITLTSQLSDQVTTASATLRVTF